jgi:2-polyprenyl-6-methoxyphenol hydroxylase-like FAD-dependent oxidoreductase
VPVPQEPQARRGTPLPDGHCRVVVTVDDAPADPDLVFAQQLLDGRAPGQAPVTGLVWSSRFRVHHRLADRYRADRHFLAGDAPPTYTAPPAARA